MITAHIIKIDPEKTSKFGKGTYTRVYLRDLNNKNQVYILDVNWQSKQWRNLLQVDNIFSCLTVFKNPRNGKLHIDGTAPFRYDGKIVKDIKSKGDPIFDFLSN